MPLPSLSIDRVLASFTQLERELVDAQKGALDPRLRAEMTRLAAASARSVAKLGAVHQQAKKTLDKKLQRGRAMVAANQAAVEQKKQAKAGKEQPAAESTLQSQPVAIDPTLGRRLAEQLLDRQRSRRQLSPEPSGPLGILDDWGAAEPTAAQ